MKNAAEAATERARRIVYEFVEEAMSAERDRSGVWVSVCDICGDADGDHLDGCPVPVAQTYLRQTR